MNIDSQVWDEVASRYWGLEIALRVKTHNEVGYQAYHRIWRCLQSKVNSQANRIKVIIQTGLELPELPYL